MKVFEKTNKKKKNKRGVALIMVLGVIAILTTIVIDFQYNSRVNMHLAGNAKDELKAFMMAKSAFNFSRLILHFQGQVDSTMKSMPMLSNLGLKLNLWEMIPIDSDLIKSLTGGFGEAGQIMDIGLSGTKGFGHFTGRFSAEIVDENRKIGLIYLDETGVDQQTVLNQLMSLIQPVSYNYMFENADADGQFSDRVETIGSILDWMDMDEQIAYLDQNLRFKAGTGSEDSRYNMLDDAYKSKNACIDTLEELHLIKGIGDDFMDTFGESLTAYPVKKINIRNADPIALKALIRAFARDQYDPVIQNEAQMDLLIAKLMEYRMLSPFNKPEEFISFLQAEGIDFNPHEMKKHIGVDSNIYRITAQGESGDIIKRLTVVLRFENGKEQLLYWRED